MRTTDVQLQRNSSMGRSRRRGRLRILCGTRVHRMLGKGRGDLSRRIGGRTSRAGVQGFPRDLGGLDLLDFRRVNRHTLCQSIVVVSSKVVGLVRAGPPLNQYH